MTNTYHYFKGSVTRPLTIFVVQPFDRLEPILPVDITIQFHIDVDIL